MTTAIESPLARLTEQELEKLAKEFDAIHDEVFAELGDRLAAAIAAEGIRPPAVWVAWAGSC